MDGIGKDRLGKVIIDPHWNLESLWSDGEYIVDLN